jgi:hypothetical protein
MTAPYTVWIDYGTEGWSPRDCATVTECLDAIAQYGIGLGYRITRPVTLIDFDTRDNTRDNTPPPPF